MSYRGDHVMADDAHCSVLGKFTDRDLAHKPFAHLVAEGALDSRLYDKLAADFPQPERFVRGIDNPASNQAIRIPARDIVDNPEFSREWREFFRYHTSQAFWSDIVRIMGNAIRAAHPDLETRMGKELQRWNVKTRGTEAQGDVVLDALYVVNTPVTELSSVRPAHVDSEDEIWAGLLYMRAEGDDTLGGDLALYHFKSRPAFGGHYAPLSALVEDKRVSYAANRLVSFVNSAQSVHGVTPRSPTPRYRRYINMVAMIPFPAFSLPKMSPWDRFKFKLERRKTKKSHGVLAKAG